MFAFLAIGSFCPARSAQADVKWSSEFRYEEAEKLLADKKWPEAIISLRGVVRDQPHLLNAVLDLGRALVYAGRREEALSFLNESIARESHAKRALLIRRLRVCSRVFLTNATFQLYQDGVNLARAKKYRAARERFEKALEAEPYNVEILTRVGQSLLLEGDYDSAAEKLRLARKLNAYEPEIHLWLGRALSERGELSEALEELKFARQSLRSSELSAIWYAEILLSTGQRAAAARLLDEDLKTHPFHLKALLQLAQMRPTDHDGSLAARKDLQIAISRLGEYAVPLDMHPDGLDLELRNPDDLKEDIQQYLEKVESRLDHPEGGAQSS